MIAQILVCISAAIALLLGTTHLVFTFRGSMLRPRDPGLETQMKLVAPAITRQTTMWKAWIGFNATHSLGIMLFGLVYGYLALMQPDVLFQSAFLAGIGGLLLLSIAILARAYFFSTPFRGVCLALICYGAGFITAWS